MTNLLFNCTIGDTIENMTVKRIIHLCGLEKKSVITQTRALYCCMHMHQKIAKEIVIHKMRLHADITSLVPFDTLLHT